MAGAGDFPGTSGPDYWWGGDLADEISGGDGKDTLGGAGGDDTVHGGAQDDELYGGTGKDALFGDAGSDVLVIVDGDDAVGETYDGGDAADALVIAASDGSTLVDLRDDFLVDLETLWLLGVWGTDTTQAGGSAEVWMTSAQFAGLKIVDSSQDSTSTIIRVVLGDETSFDPDDTKLVGLDDLGDRFVIVGGDKAEWIWGSGGRDVIEGHGGDDRLMGSSHDTLRGGAGYDTLSGGIAAYDDIDKSVVAEQHDGTGSVWVDGVLEDSLFYASGIIGGSANDIFRGDWEYVDGGDGYDTMDFSTSSSLAALMDGERLRLLRVEKIIGTDSDDRLFGDGSLESLLAGRGNDTVLGGGTATLDGGDGKDTVDFSEQAGAVRFTLAGSKLASVKVNGSTFDSVRNFENAAGGWGNDTLTGSSGSNTISGGPGQDMLDGAGGRDTLSYLLEEYAVKLTLGGSRWVTVGGGIGDRIRNFENVQGSSLDDRITGDGVANSLYGHQGNDILKGGSGNDTIEGGDGSDTLYGGAGNDRFVFRDYLSGDVDRIADFKARADKIAIDIDGPARFSVSSKAHTVGFRYDPNSGKLYYDDIGFSSGHIDYESHHFATLGKHLSLSTADVLFI